MNVLIWDFDGVIIQSDHVRELGFRECLNDFPLADVDKLIAYHKLNGGLSRYHKLEYFFTEIHPLKEYRNLMHDRLKIFGEIMLRNLKDKTLLNLEVVKVIKSSLALQYIASGSDQTELRELVRFLGLEPFFIDILGSPTKKVDLVKTIVNKHKDIPVDEICMIGDSINDFDAAKANKIQFFGYNGDQVLIDKSTCTLF